MIIAETRDPTADRVRSSENERARTRALIRQGKLLSADTPERVEKRKARLLDHPQYSLVLSPDDRKELSVRAVADVPEQTQQAFERQIGGNDTQPAWFLTRGADVRRTVGRIHIRRADRRIGWATGFLIAPHLLLTNHHVLDSIATARSSRVEFGYEETYEGDIAPTAIFDLEPDVLFVCDSEVGGRDYAVVAVTSTARPDCEQPDAKLFDFGYTTLVAAEGKMVKGELINAIHHPEGQPRSVSIRENRLTALSEPALQGRWMHYETDTEPGSSGAPLFNDQWEVVGLHHRGVEKRDESGRILALGGSVWSPEMGERLKWWEANEGLRISAFLAHATEQVLTAHEGVPTQGNFVGPNGRALFERMIGAGEHPVEPAPTIPSRERRTRPTQPLDNPD